MATEMSSDQQTPVGTPGELSRLYREIRAFTEKLAAPLSPEDCVVQSMPDVSPTKWHLAHTTWFFETFVLQQQLAEYRPFHPRYGYLFNSYYNAIGERHPRPKRGLLSRPSLEEVYAYRESVDRWMLELLDKDADTLSPEALGVIEIGLHHEQQHQELLLTDIKHVLSCNPLRPAYVERVAHQTTAEAVPCYWHEFPEQLVEIGHEGGSFAYDNEKPRHRVFLNPFKLCSRLVTNGEYLQFIADNGYRRPELWLSDGWATVTERQWEAPLYWEKLGDTWFHQTLAGLVKVHPANPVCHVSYYEADAFARWRNARLPTEAEWEVAATPLAIEGNFVETERFHPSAATESRTLTQMYGDVWEWTASPYSAYPGYRPAEGAIGEYNGKFMCNQFVLRGGSCVTSQSHIRPTYRNFFPPDARWQFTGIRLADDL